MRAQKRRAALGIAGLATLAATMMIAFSAAGGASAKPSGIFALPRSQTLYTTGTMWGPYSDLNPFKNWDYVTGTIGLVYETLFVYDPLTDKFTPWLASSGSWTNKTTYVVNVRSGVKWSDGKPLTAADVKFSFETAKTNTAIWLHPLWTTGGLRSITTSGSSVTFHFAATSNYQEWASDLYNVPIVPQHVWKAYKPADIASGNLPNVHKLIGTGPYTFMAGLNSNESLTWQKRTGWWATKVYGLDPKPKYIVDIYNGSNNASLANLLAGNLDLSNNFLPGIDKYSGKQVGTYYSGRPYMLAGNTAWLVPNTTKAPLNDPKFRRALAESINTQQIVDQDYSGIVSKSGPTGLLPTWSKYIDQNAVKKYGFTYSTAQAKADLAAAGYKVGSDGYVTNKDGSAINLSLVVPNGWSDWQTAIQIITADAKEAGIHITPGSPDYNTLVDDRNKGNYDLVLNNDKQIGNTPWTYYDFMFELPIQSTQTTVNFERYSNAKAWALTQQLDRTNPSDLAGMKKILSQLETIQMQDLPVIPLWFNGVWSQWNPSHWTNWPSSKGKGLQNIPAFWRGYFQMGAIKALTNLKPKS